ncbi:hypothetical protein SAMN02745157_0695 [Kaistia soli DSM 19436]|uniref:Uncharacterized protein n=1 Tax=Kaistia soli DSM 19436 TaxID=1122133 RepID=A0A1M4VGF9_9HYPH|nr:hypothetical protein [Kaistia soli]SHE67895.1 hypothetical protein SAMN02745157_0695 [Kaistia soli DSM 19436]
MQSYRIVGGTAHIGLGEVVVLTHAQFASRAHNVDVVRRSGKRVEVRARVPLEFKDGEIIGLHAEPPKNIVHLLVAEEKGEKAKEPPPITGGPPQEPPAPPEPPAA